MYLCRTYSKDFHHSTFKSVLHVTLIITAPLKAELIIILMICQELCLHVQDQTGWNTRCVVETFTFKLLVGQMTRSWDPRRNWTNQVFNFRLFCCFRR